ncbi:DUF1992 domain-containing protein [Kineosporia sp. NBRC 101677]|uniref:DnaJ family domain-containing protein n=1 Tax=Kineosporia sp. NBRC 101677 TaxID=3032197 RepID=UPI002553D861|nr:DUF1992 domain-containing protein [Kineosporia sp. NBRC 101677]
MTEKKPAHMRHEDWVERQLREARERGAFDNLDGHGKPLRSLDRPFSAEQWARDWVERSGGDLQALLPPLLILRKERAALLQALPTIGSEQVLRETVADFNARLLDQYRRPMDGPLIAVGVLDADETVALWQQARPEPEPVPEPAPSTARPGLFARVRTLVLNRRGRARGGSVQDRLSRVTPASTSSSEVSCSWLRHAPRSLGRVGIAASSGPMSSQFRWSGGPSDIIVLPYWR